MSETAPASFPPVARPWRAIAYLLTTILLIFGLYALGGNIKKDFRADPIAATTTDPDATNPRLVTLDWKVLKELQIATGQMSDRLSRANHRAVRIPGYIVPLEDNVGQASEFLLVPYVGACVHTPPPPANQIVSVRMEANRATKVNATWEPVWVHGELDINPATSPYGKVAFQLKATKVVPY